MESYIGEHSDHFLFILLSRTGTVGWTKCWVKVPKCAVPDHCVVYTGSELSSSSRRLRREPDTPKYHHRWFHIARIWARVTRIGFWLFNYVMMASYQWLCIETYLILKSYIKNIFDQETAYVCAMPTQKPMWNHVLSSHRVFWPNKVRILWYKAEICIYSFATR